MKGVSAWLEGRRPPPPPELRASLRPGVAEGPVMEALLELAVSRLAEACARPGRERESAFRLLEADALLTYASEAALESDDPDGALLRLVGAC